ncbi:type II and III secretion system protein family protein [Halomonas sp. DP8Y7-3]|uniref:type II and III secretion system protein family protein n=1 Tax=Halomonas sp. DP8Y7-3 TaxID=2859079 RepID=UPI001C9381A3|nr:type II and III secretion system protein family protein [Halomonas sp. DP8Y7-3]MBY5930032.1 type II and III secretion system protein family protein [Halomonas sp. DP8Y7-3]
MQLDGKIARPRSVCWRVCACGTGRGLALGKRLVAALLLAVALIPAVGLAQSPESRLSLAVGDQQWLGQPGRITRTAVGRGDIIDAQVLDPRSLLVTAVGPGSTSLKVWVDGASQPRETLIQVRPAGGEGLESEYSLAPGTSRPNVRGVTRSLERHDQAISRFASDPIDGTTQAGPVQVQTDIRVVEVNRSRMASAGFFIGRNQAGSTRFALGRSDETLDFLAGGAVAPNAGDGGFSIIQVNTSGVLSALSALSANGFAYTLAEPSLVSLSGQSASFLAGGEFPFPVQSGDDQISVDFKEFGIRLQLTPTVLDERRIMLKVAPEVSELDFSRGVQTAGIAVPALNVRRTDTTVQLGNGESFIISGLVSRNIIQSVDKIPGLGDIPVIGAFFRSTRLDRDEKELVMIVTPHLVRPLAAGVDLGPMPGAAFESYDPNFLELMFDPQDAQAIERVSEVGFSR